MSEYEEEGRLKAETCGQGGEVRQRWTFRQQPQKSRQITYHRIVWELIKIAAKFY